MNAPGRPILELRRATFRLDERLVFRRTDWTLRRGEHWLVLGPTGSGKSVFCRALRGELPLVAGAADCRFPPAPGRIPEDAIAYLAAEHWSFDPADGPPARWFSLDCEQSPLVADVLTWASVEEINPFEIVRRRTADVARWKRRAQSIVRALAIEPLLAKPLLALSNGERRKIALARALMRAPKILVLDDPFAGLDAAFRRHLRDLLESLIRRRAVALVLVGADPADWPRGLTHALRIDRFRVADQGPLARLRRTSAVARLLRAAAPPSRARSARRTGATGAELVRFRDVRIGWDETCVLEHVDWTVRAGESWAIVGPNGSGKSSLLSFVLGDNPQVYANDVRLFGRRRGTGESIWDVQRRIGRVSPEFQATFDPDLTGLETVLTGFRDIPTLCARPTARQIAVARGWLRRLGLTSLAARVFGRLSAGEQRLLLLARALVKSPRLLVLDEPCQGLDRAHRRRFVVEVDRRIRQGATALYVTHRRDEIPAAIRRVLRLGGGRARPGAR